MSVQYLGKLIRDVAFVEPEVRWDSIFSPENIAQHSGELTMLGYALGMALAGAGAASTMMYFSRKVQEKGYNGLLEYFSKKLRG
jgi:hypothetical protein